MVSDRQILIGILNSVFSRLRGALAVFPNTVI